MNPIVIVGAGLSGLTCALTLHEAGHQVLVLESSDGVGGRVRTDRVNGYLLDRGFQVFLEAYPEAGRLLDLPALDLKSFEPGALVFDGEKLNRVMDVFRRPKALLASAFSPVGSLFDKLRVAVLRQKVLNLDPEDLFARPDQSTEAYLRGLGFSGRMIDGFFRSFYGGIFLERELQTSSRMFEFTFRMFSEGSATVPAKGMGEIPAQLASRLPDNALRFRSPVTTIAETEVTLESGEVIKAAHVVVATGAHVAGKLVPGFRAVAPKWRAVTNVHFEAEESPIGEAIIVLNGTSSGLVNNVAVMSDVSADYAPKGKALISVSVLGVNEDDDLPSLVQAELEGWFGKKVASWIHLKTDLIRAALPEQRETNPVGVRTYDGVLVCGDHAVSASIEGAVISGKAAAEAILATS